MPTTRIATTTIVCTTPTTVFDRRGLSYAAPPLTVGAQYQLVLEHYVPGEWDRDSEYYRLLVYQYNGTVRRLHDIGESNDRKLLERIMRRVVKAGQIVAEAA